MARNIFTDTEIQNISKTLFDIIKTEEKSSKQDMKTYLNQTSLSDEAKVKEYATFGKELFATKVSAVVSNTLQYLLSEEQASEQRKVNTAQINLSNAQKTLAETENTNAGKQGQLIDAQKAQVEMETDAIKSKIWLAIMETKAKTDLTVAQTLSEARRNGATVSNISKTWTDPITNQAISYSQISLAAVEATNMTAGEIGRRMALWDKQTNSFNKHAKVQTLGQYINLLGVALDSGATGIDGLLTTVKTIADDVTELTTSSISNVAAG